MRVRVGVGVRVPAFGHDLEEHEGPLHVDLIVELRLGDALAHLGC